MRFLFMRLLFLSVALLFIGADQVLAQHKSTQFRISSEELDANVLRLQQTFGPLKSYSLKRITTSGTLLEEGVTLRDRSLFAIKLGKKCRDLKAHHRKNKRKGLAERLLPASLCGTGSISVDHTGYTALFPFGVFEETFGPFVYDFTGISGQIERLRTAGFRCESKISLSISEGGDLKQKKNGKFVIRKTINPSKKGSFSVMTIGVSARCDTTTADFNGDIGISTPQNLSFGAGYCGVIAKRKRDREVLMSKKLFKKVCGDVELPVPDGGSSDCIPPETFIDQFCSDISEPITCVIMTELAKHFDQSSCSFSGDTNTITEVILSVIEESCDLGIYTGSICQMPHQELFSLISSVFSLFTRSYPS